ncbi:MAG: hypothetical protein ACI95C_002946 [Pseudohongiellaceae bacterium]|jgi:hypothetical protein
MDNDIGQHKQSERDRSGRFMAKELKFPFDLDLSSLDTGSITNILNDIEHHLPLMESNGDLVQLLEVKEFFECELKESRRLH